MSRVPGFLKSFGTKVVRVIPAGGERVSEGGLTLEAHVQARKAFFAVDAPVYGGDILEVPDPRGGYSRFAVVDVRVHDYGPAEMRHLEAHIVPVAPEGR